MFVLHCMFCGSHNAGLTHGNYLVLLQCILGEYEWESYSDVLEDVKGLGRGLALTGMSPSMFILIFAETRADWMIAAQACFRQNFAGDNYMMNAELMTS